MARRTPGRHQSRPGDGLARLLPVLAVATLLVNDHWLKAHHPGLVSGKLSDFAGLAFFPLLLQALAELVRPRWTGSRRLLVACCVATVAGFAVVKCWPPGALAYGWAVGTLQWPFRWALAAATGGLTPRLAPGRVWIDPTDLVALPMVLFAARVGWSRGGPGATDAPE